MFSETVGGWYARAVADFDLQLMIREAFQTVSSFVSRELQKGLTPDERPRPLGGLELRWGPPVSIAHVGGGAALEETAPAHQQDDGCPACELHAEMADVRGLADGLAASAEADGTIPSPQAGTIPLIRATLDQASRQADTLVAARPDLREQAGQLQSQIKTAKAVIPAGQTVTASGAAQLAGEVNDAWQQAYGLTVAYWTPAAKPSVIRTWYQQSQREHWSDDEAMARLQEMMSADG